MPKKQPLDLADQLRQAIADSGLTHYSIGRDAGISPSVLDRFVLPLRDPRRRDLRLATAGKVATLLGLSLRCKPAAKKTAEPHADGEIEPDRMLDEISYYALAFLDACPERAEELEGLLLTWVSRCKQR